MLAASTLRYLSLAYLSKPRHDRQLYRAIRTHRITSVVEIGVGDGSRAMRLISVAQRYCQPQDVRYTGIDPFEGLQDQRRSLSLKAAHRMLKKSGARGQMIPGDPYRALARTANTLLGTDLLIIAEDYDPASLELAWFYVPRMLHENSLVLIERPAVKNHPAQWQRLTRIEIEQFAGQPQARRAA